MLAVTYGLEKFHHYTFGRDVEVTTDHKPLVSITTKPLSRAPKRLQNLLLRAQKYSYKLKWKPGVDIPLADALSRAPTDNPIEEEVVNVVVTHNMGDERLQQIRGATAIDKTLVSLGKIIAEGWPNDKRDVPVDLLPFFNYRDELSTHDGIVYRSNRIVIPSSLRREMKQRVHTGHLGINSCLRRARDVMYWPGMSSEIRHYIETCGTCATYCDKQPQESPIITEVPDRPWKKVASDLFSYGGRDYLITTDYHSNFYEVDLLTSTNATVIVMKTKAHFARYGTPDELVSDNGPQYTAEAFRDFAKQWQFKHVTSSPGHSQANGAAEVAVRSIKRILRKCQAAKEDPYLALLNLRNTPNEGLNTSPAQRLLGRRTKSLLPMANSKLMPCLLDPRYESVAKENHRVKTTSTQQHKNDLRPLEIGQTVRMQPIGTREREWQQATVSKSFGNRSYEVQNDSGRRYRRNRRHLRSKPRSAHTCPPVPSYTGAPNKQRSETTPSSQAPTPVNDAVPDTSQKAPNSPQKVSDDKNPDQPMTTQPMPTTRSGRTVKLPARYRDD